jgi:hypothetical protein
VDLTLVGVGLGNFQGQRVTALIGTLERAPERLGWGDQLIDGGAFGFVFPLVWEVDLYKRKLVYIDVDANGRCDTERDLLFGDYRATRASELFVKWPDATGIADMRPSSEGCDAFNAAWSWLGE